MIKRTEKYALMLIANQLDFLEGRYDGCREHFTEKELAHASVILDTLKAAEMIELDE